MKIDLLRIPTDYKGEYCFTHARAALRPDGFGIMTTQPLRLSGSDIFYGMYMLKTYDGGKSWSEPVACEHIVRTPFRDGQEIAMCDATPFYHKASGKILLIGHCAVYQNDEFPPGGYPTWTLYSIYDEEKGDFGELCFMESPEGDEFFRCANGSGQMLELENGEILLPVTILSAADAADAWHACSSSLVFRCTFDGEKLYYSEYGNKLTLSVPRGFCEASVAEKDGEYFLCLRNDLDGYLTKSADGLHYSEPVPLCFDDGESVGNYCTQQHWFNLDGRLFLVYTRRDASNGHIFRHRAPLYFAELDTEKLCLIRSTEEIAVPERGARLGNFGVISLEDRAMVIVSEWMQGPDGTPKDPEKYGADNSIFVSTIRPE